MQTELTPRRPRSGMRLTRSEADLLVDCRSAPWMQLLCDRFDESVRSAGVEYARNGQVLSLICDPGRIVVDVQGAQRRPNRIALAIRRFSEPEWRRTIDCVSSHAVLSAAVLTGDLPESCVRTLDEAGISMSPRENDVTIDHDVTEPFAAALVCASVLLVAQHLLDSPLDLILVRGMRPEALCERIRQQRALDARGVVAAHIEPRVEDNAREIPFDDCLDEFWEPLAPALGAADSGTHRHVMHALLRRLGPSPLSGRFPIVGILASVYDEVSQELRDKVAGESEADSSAENEVE